MDETLVHCNTENIENSDKIITVTLNENQKVNAGVNIRPYAIECLKELAEYYELIVFTASHPYYADRVIDLLDPDKKIFSKRLFRSSCIRTDINIFIKDLRILNCDLKSTLIVDNSILSFAFQLDNGIPIIPFYDNKEDKIFPKIKDYIISLKDMDDVRIANRKTFSLMELYELNISSFLKYYYDDPDQIDKDEEKEVKIDNTTKEDQTNEDNNSSKLSAIQNTVKIGKKAQAVVDDQLEKLQQSLPKYLAKHQNV